MDVEKETTVMLSLIYLAISRFFFSPSIRIKS